MSLKASRFGSEKGRGGGGGRGRGGGRGGGGGRRGNRMDAMSQPYPNRGSSSRTGKDSSSVNSAAEGTRLYVGNLSWEISWQDLKDHMKTAGNVVRADVLMEANGRRSKGCGIVEYATVEEAQAAIAELNDSELRGRPIFIREDREQKGVGTAPKAAAALVTYNNGNRVSNGGKHGGNSHAMPSYGGDSTVYVGNLSWEVQWQDLKDHMKHAGNVLRADVMTEHNGRSKGCGLVTFASAEEARVAIGTLNDTELKGRPIFVREDREPGGGAGGSGNHEGSSATAATGGGSSGAHRGANNAARGGSEPGSRVYIGNLSWEVQWQDLKDHMKQIGHVLRADVLTEPSGRSKGCGLVEYATAAMAQQAIETLNDSELKGRPIFVREDREAGGGGGQHATLSERFASQKL